MKKTVAIACLYLVATLALQARTPRLEFGVEWGYCPALFYWNHLEYLTDDQYFIRSKGRDWTYTSNGMAIIYAGLDINSRAVIRLHAGYQGVDRGLRTIPVGLQAAYYFAGTSSQGWLTFVGTSVGISMQSLPPSLTLDIGAGYRFELGSRFYFDMKAAFRFSSAQPENIWDPITELLVTRPQMRVCDHYLGGISLSMALVFR